MAMIKIKNLTKTYGDKVVLDNLDLEFESGKITAILGESGSGKTTLLNIIAGITDYQGEVLRKSDNISVVFQKDRLIKNLTVSQNLKLVCQDIDVDVALQEVGLNGIGDYYVKNLSAGMSRRVAIVRAIHYPSDILLMDEPLINLDLAHKYLLIEKIKNISDRTVLFVTHDIKEALLVADRILVLANGKIVKDVRKINKKTEEELFGLMMNVKNL
jgi:NitT/TauT family transport system ATP-binding protein